MFSNSKQFNVMSKECHGQMTQPIICTKRDQLRSKSSLIENVNCIIINLSQAMPENRRWHGQAENEFLLVKRFPNTGATSRDPPVFYEQRTKSDYKLVHTYQCT